jgi:hypothetical protein
MFPLFQSQSIAILSPEWWEQMSATLPITCQAGTRAGISTKASISMERAR